MGIILILAAALIIVQGAQVFTPLANIVGLSSHYTVEHAILPPTLFNIPASNFSFVSEELSNGDRVSGSLEVTNGRDVAFYVMNEGNFSLWRAGRPSALVLVEPAAYSYNFTLSLNAAGTYYFVFDNQDTTPRVVIFSLNALEAVTVLNPLLQYAGFELLLVGAVLTMLGFGGRKKRKLESTIDRPPAVEVGWKCKFCGAMNENQESTFCVKCGRSQG